MNRIYFFIILWPESLLHLSVKLNFFWGANPLFLLCAVFYCEQYFIANMNGGCEWRMPVNEYSFVTIRAWTKNFPHEGLLIIAQWTILTIVRVFLQQNVLDVGYVCVWTCDPWNLEQSLYQWVTNHVLANHVIFMWLAVLKMSQFSQFSLKLPETN